MRLYWYKTHVSDILSPERSEMPDWLFRRLVEFEAIAADYGFNGLLPPVKKMAWSLHLKDEMKLREALTALSEVGEVEETPKGWVLVHFKERQESESAERVRRHREKERNVTEVTDVTDVAEEPLHSPLLYSDSFLKEGGMGGETLPVPETMKEASEHPDIQTFQKVSGVFPPSKHYQEIVEVMRHLRNKHGERLESYLAPFWAAWSTRKTKDKKPYSKTNPTWLIEWAFQGEIPQTNGHEPQGIFTPIPSVEATRKAIEEKDKLDALVMQQRLAKGMHK